MDQLKKFRIWVPALNIVRGDDMEVTAFTPSEAAESFVENYDRSGGDMVFARNPGTIVCILTPNGKVKKFAITIESVPRYGTEEI